MRLHFVELENWRKHEKKSIIFDEKATIIHGPNESGKSTILEALFRGLFDRHSTGAEEVRKITPLTTRGGVPSTVRISYSVGGSKYLVVKTFNHGAETELYQLENGSKRLIARDDPADKQVIDMLEAEMETRGASDPAKWGAFYWLWTLQERRELPREGDPASILNLEHSGDVLITPKFDSVMKDFQKYYETYFTPKGKDYTHSPVVELQGDLEALRQEKNGLNLRISEVQGYRQELENKLIELPRLEKSLEESRIELKIAYEESQDARAIESELDACKSKLNEFNLKKSEAEKALKELRDAATKISELTTEQEKLRDKLSQIDIQCGIYENQIESLEEELGKKTDELAEFEDLVADARILWTKKRNQEALDALKQKSDRIQDLEEKISNLRSKQQNMIITDKELRELENDQTTLNLRKDQLSESGLLVERIPGSDGELKVSIDGIDLGIENQDTAVEEVLVYHEGLGEVKVRADIDKARDLQQDVEILGNKIEKALKINQTISLEELRKVFDKNLEITSSIKNLLSERKGIDDRSKEEILTELETLEDNSKRYDEIERSNFAIEKNPVDVDLSELVKKREKELKEVSDSLDSLRCEREEQRKEYNNKREERAKIKAVQESAQKQLNEAYQNQQDLIKEYGSERIQNEKLREIREDISLEEERKDELKEKYREFQEGPLAAIKRLETTIENREKLLQSHRGSIDQLRGQIKQSSVDGAYSRLSKVETDIEVCKKRLNREQLKANAVMTLKTVMEEQHKTAIGSITKPIRDDVQRFLAYVTGNLHDEVELDKNLFPVRIGERGMDQLALDYEDGSSGLREVLGLCVRLAIAKHLCKNEPQCLLLDDPFVHVSTNRSEKMIELINKIIEETSLQTIILTHRPFEFAGFDGTLVDIQM
jgi:DNA repair exonuclease SbcCD ATPase subunit